MEAAHYNKSLSHLYTNKHQNDQKDTVEGKYLRIVLKEKAPTIDRITHRSKKLKSLAFEHSLDYSRHLKSLR
jgi:hypothetical protein